MNKKPVETIMGLVVLVVAALFMVFAYRVSDLQVVKGYEITARFLKVGTVTFQKINPLDYMVDVKMNISPEIVLSADSQFSVAGDGLMGDKFIKIEPGNKEEKLTNGSIVENTKDAKSLEDLVGEIIFMVTGDENK